MTTCITLCFTLQFPRMYKFNCPVQKSFSLMEPLKYFGKCSAYKILMKKLYTKLNPMILFKHTKEAKNIMEIQNKGKLILHNIRKIHIILIDI